MAGRNFAFFHLLFYKYLFRYFICKNRYSRYSIINFGVRLTHIIVIRYFFFSVDDKWLIYCRTWIFATANSGKSADNCFRRSKEGLAAIKSGRWNKQHWNIHQELQVPGFYWQVSVRLPGPVNLYIHKHIPGWYY